MLNRSDIDLVNVSTSGENIGTGKGIFKCKDITGNTLQFRTICGAGGISIITGDTLIISGGTGAFPPLTGITNYVLKVNSLGNNIEASSIYDSGLTNVIIKKNVVYIGDGTGSTVVTIKPTNPRIIELVASSGVNIGNLTKCVCFGSSGTGLCICAASQDDLCIHAGSPSGTGSGCKLLLSGGDGSAGTGGNVVICGGDGSSAVGGNVTITGGIGSSYGNVKICNLPTSTQACTLYIDGSGNLSKGIPFSGTSYWKKSGGFLCPVTVTDNVSIRNGQCYIWDNTTRMTSYSGGSGNVWCVDTGTAKISTSFGGFISSQSSAGFVVANYAFTNYVEYSPAGEILNPTGNLNMNPKSKNDGTKACYIKMCGGQNTSSGLGGDICLMGGSSTLGTGGNVYIDVANYGGANKGQAYICGLQAKTSETCGIFINAAGKLSVGVISGGTGGGGTITGATSLGSGYAVYSTVANCNLKFKSLLAGGGIGISCTANDITICGLGWSSYGSGGVGGSTVIGCGTVASGGTIICNTFIGVCAGKGITFGYGNTGIGFESLCKTTTGYYNTAVGFQSLVKNITGTDNIGLGNGALQNNTIGSHNVGIGGSSLAFTTLGCFNTAVGSGSLANNCASCYNTGVGYGVLYYNSGGTGNVAVGYRALFGTAVAGAKTGSNNTGVGIQALMNNTTGNNNVAMGMAVMVNNSIGNSNIGIGVNALMCNTTGNYNIAIGYATMQGPAAPNTGNDNIAIGQSALLCNTGGNCNIAIGFEAGKCNSTGACNVGIGFRALCKNTTGLDNVAIGLYTLGANTTGCENVAIGRYTMNQNTTGCDNIAMGNAALMANTTGKNNIILGYATYGQSITGSGNVAIGYSAAQFNLSGNCNVFLGFCAGGTEYGSNKLHIANNGSCTLICGDFLAKSVKVDCNLQVCKDLQSLTNGGGLILCSPSGTKFCLTVSNAGALVITAI